MELLLLLRLQQPENHEIDGATGHETGGQERGPRECGNGQLGRGLSGETEFDRLHHVDQERRHEHGAGVDGRYDRGQQQAGEHQTEVVSKGGARQEAQQPEEKSKTQTRKHHHRAEAKNAHGHEKAVGSKSRKHRLCRRKAESQRHQQRKQSRYVFINQLKHPHDDGCSEYRKENRGFPVQTKIPAKKQHKQGQQDGHKPAKCMDGFFSALFGRGTCRICSYALAANIGEQREVKLGLVARIELVESGKARPGDGEDNDLGYGQCMRKIVRHIRRRLLAEPV